MDALLRQREREGLTFAGLSARSGVPAATLSWWNQRLKRESPNRFAEVVVVDQDSASESTVAESEARGHVRIEVAGLVIAVSEGFSNDCLGQVLDVVRSRC